MAKTVTVRVFAPFNSYLRILEAYNTENFQRSNPRNYSRNVCFTIGVTVFIGLVPCFIAFSVWYIFDNGANMNLILVETPLMLTILQLIVILWGLIAQNRFISHTINRIQFTVDQRMYFMRKTNIIF